jgi:catechol 2,3-dioxygenase-like lactoylglutathione lyase family enzyme
MKHSTRRFDCSGPLRLVAVVTAAWSIATPAQAAAPLVQALDSVAMTVGDADVSRDFFERVLDFQLVSDTEVSGEAYEHLYGVFGLRMRIVTLRLGDERLELDQYLSPRGRPFPADSNSNDRLFQHVAIIVADMDSAFAHLREHKVAFASSGPQLLPAWNPAAGGIAAFYFRDPDGHYLEILHFPPGRGDPKWQLHSDRLFLGIDHTAIVVADTDASLRFYRDTLGLKVVGASENFGTEQEHLNNVFGARLRITALRAEHGPGVELLEYLAPRNGRAMPADTRGNDIWHWQINWSSDVDRAEKAVRSDHDTMISPGVILLGSSAGHTALQTTAMSIADPDGHASVLSQVAPRP